MDAWDVGWVKDGVCQITRWSWSVRLHAVVVVGGDRRTLLSPIFSAWTQQLGCVGHIRDVVSSKYACTILQAPDQCYNDTFWQLVIRNESEWPAAADVQ